MSVITSVVAEKLRVRCNLYCIGEMRHPKLDVTHRATLMGGTDASENCLFKDT